MNTHRPLCDALRNLKRRLHLATQFDAADYANWVRYNATRLCVGFDQWLREQEGDIHPSEHVVEMSVYGRMQYARSTGIGV
jgi:hypothetical protein